MVLVEELKEFSKKGVKKAEDVRLLLSSLADRLKGYVVFSTSFSYEDQYITDIILRNNIDIEIFTIDTGRLHEETYKVFDETIKVYGNVIKVYYPNNIEVEELLMKKGPYSFYNSLEDREECCRIRKLNPLSVALSGKCCWVTGIRREQSQFRSKKEIFEIDEKRGLIKCNPILDISIEDIIMYIKEKKVPYNSLYDKGYTSIGCEPCTRAVKEGEDIRAGRWWWELDYKKECGLHK